MPCQLRSVKEKLWPSREHLFTRDYNRRIEQGHIISLYDTAVILCWYHPLYNCVYSPHCKNKIVVCANHYAWLSFLCNFNRCGAYKTFCQRLVKFTQVSTPNTWIFSSTAFIKICVVKIGVPHGVHFLSPSASTLVSKTKVSKLYLQNLLGGRPATSILLMRLPCLKLNQSIKQSNNQTINQTINQTCPITMSRQLANGEPLPTQQVNSKNSNRPVTCFITMRYRQVQK